MLNATRRLVHRPAFDRQHQVARRRFQDPDYETIVKLISRTATVKGLKVTCRLDR